jgi:hypothetical protein
VLVYLQPIVAVIFVTYQSLGLWRALLSASFLLKSAHFLLDTSLCGDFSGSRIQFRFEENADEATHLQAHRSGGRHCTDVDERRFAQFSLRVS